MQAGSRVEEFPSRSEMLALLLSTVPGGVVTLRPTLPWGSTRNAAGPPLPDGTIPHIDLNSAVWRADKLSDAQHSDDLNFQPTSRIQSFLSSAPLRENRVQKSPYTRFASELVLANTLFRRESWNTSGWIKIS